MPDVILEEIEDDKKNRPFLYKHKWLGEPNSLESRIYKNWKMIDEIPHEARLERYGLDFGYTNDPTALVALYYYNGGYIIDEVCFQKGLLNKQIADLIKDQDNNALVVADSAEPKSIDEIRGYGVNITGCKKRKDPSGKHDSFVKWRIAQVQDQKISVTKQSINVIKEYRNYLWEVDKSGKILNIPEHTFSHSMDAAGYAISSIVGGQSSEVKTKLDQQFMRNFNRQMQNSSK